MSVKNIVLCVDDDSTVLTALRNLFLKVLGSSAEVEVAESGREALELANELKDEGREISVIISDFIMPAMRGDELLIRLHEMSPRTVKIMLTGQSDLKGIVRTINEAKLYRFIEKPFNNADLMLTVKSALQAYIHAVQIEKHTAELERINAELESQVIERSQKIIEQNKQLEEKVHQLEQMAAIDALTGLFNRMKLNQFLEAEIGKLEGGGAPFAVLFLQVDNLRAVNDKYGHTVGDQIIVAMSSLLNEWKRADDIVGRWGGEKFLILCPNLEMERAMDVAEDLRQRAAQHSFPIVEKATVSIGVTGPKNGDNATSLFARVDRAVRKARTQGKNRVEGEHGVWGRVA